MLFARPHRKKRDVIRTNGRRFPGATSFSFILEEFILSYLRSGHKFDKKYSFRSERVKRKIFTFSVSPENV